MSAMETSGTTTACIRCGTAYGVKRGNFAVCHGDLYKGAGYLPYCRSCVDAMYGEFLAGGVSPVDAARQVCRKLDLYWNRALFHAAERGTAARSVMTNYLQKCNTVKFVGKSYTDTLREEGTLWSFAGCGSADGQEDEAAPAVPEEIRLFWGPGYTQEMYRELEDRRKFWMSRYPDGYQPDIGEEALIRQICNLEIDINHDRAAGKSVVNNVNTLNTLLGSLNLKPAQKKNDADGDVENMPLGVGIQKWELSRPLPETEEKCRDKAGRVRYITTWFLGHACKMVGLRNSYTKLYEDAMNDLRVQHPEYDDDDDDALLSDLFGNSGGDSG
jgi:hypothetical protein